MRQTNLRSDILQLSETTLTDLTNRGTMRRARKAMDALATETGTTDALVDRVTEMVSVQDNGTVAIEVAGERCELFAGKPFSDWTCTCVRATSCQHMVQAVLIYQLANGGNIKASTSSGTSSSAATSVAAQATSAQVERGVVGIIHRHKELTVVRISYPVPVTVRFLQGLDTAYARCTCANADPCAHVPLALGLLTTTDADETFDSIRVLPGDTWQPNNALMDDIKRQLTTLFDVGIESGHDTLMTSWNILRNRCAGAQLPYLVDLIDEIMQLQQRRAERHVDFNPRRFVQLVSELSARIESLSRGTETIIPHRIVTGVEAKPVKLTRSMLIGLGSEVHDLPGGCEIVAHLVDSRSGQAVRVTKIIDTEVDTPAYRLANRKLGSATLRQWGGGQILVNGGRRDSRGVLDPGRAKLVAFEATALVDAPPPFAIGKLAELGEQTLPTALDDRSATSGLTAIIDSHIVNWGYAPEIGGFAASLSDSDSELFRMEFTASARTVPGASALAQLVHDTAEEGKPISISGYWNGSQGSRVVNPLLVSSELGSVQPQLAAPVAGFPVPDFSAMTVGSSASTGTDRSINSDDQVTAQLEGVAAVTATVTAVLGQTLISGLARLRRDPDFLPRHHAALQAQGSSWFADQVALLNTSQGAAAATRLFLALAVN